MKNSFWHCLTTVPFLFVFLLWSPAFSVNNAEEENRLRKENKLLEVELKSADKPVTYVVLDMDKKKIYFKIRGVILKEFDIINTEVLGIGHLKESYQLNNIKAIFSPKRKEIKPSKQRDTDRYSDNPQEKDTFGIEDMPSSYTMIFDNGLIISVTPQFHDGFFFSILNRINSGMKRFWNSSELVWKYFKKNPFIKIQVVMSSDNARAIYWSLSEKTKFIIIGHP